MKVVFLKEFEKALAKIKDLKPAQTIQLVIQSLEQSPNLSSLSNIKKLQGHKSAYRLRIGSYRIGFFFLNGVITFAAFDNGKDIYKNFP